MKNNKKYYYFFLVLFFFTNSFANESINFLSLKNSKVNLRLGPSFEYPIKLTYNKKYLPIIVLGKSEAWREIIDFEKNSGWVHISQLSKKKTALNSKDNSVLYKKPTIYSKPIAKLEVGRLLLIKKCNEDWCKITTGNFSGWIIKGSLWGKIN